MSIRRRLAVATFTALAMLAAAGLRGQAPQETPPPPAPVQPPEGHGGPPPPGQTPAPAPEPRDQRFPAQQRSPADPAVIERGRALYAGACGACHGVDARGGQLGGPNLLRSQLVLNDQNGELILPVVRNGRPGTIMAPMPMSAEDVTAIAAYLHSLQAQGDAQGAPPPGPPVELNILVGSARAGEKFFAANCSSCHSASGDLAGLASRVAEPKALQNLWVSGGRTTGRGPGRRRAATGGVTAIVTRPGGERIEGALVRMDNFLVTVALPDGTTRSVRRRGDQPAVEIRDPLEKHRELLAVLTDTNMHDVTAYLATFK